MLVKLYRSILASLSVVADDDGLLSLRLYRDPESDDSQIALVVDGRRLALPTREILSHGKSPDLMPFHPVSESYTRGESKVFQQLKKLVVIRVQQILLTQLDRLVQIAANRSLHSSMSPKAHTLLSCLPDADERTVNDMRKIIDALADSGQSLFSVYVKRGGTLHSRTMHRVAVASWPIFELFDTDDDRIAGVKVRKKDQRGFLELLRYILPKIEEKEGYNAGSMSNVCPYLDSLIQMFVKIARDLNDVTETQRKQLGADFHDELFVDLSWEDSVRDWTAYREDIPPLEDSMGEVEAGTKTPQMPATAPAPVRRPSAAESESQPVPSAHAEKAPLTAEELLAASRRPVMQPVQPVYQPVMQPTITATGDYPGYHRGVPLRPQMTAYGQYAPYGMQPVHNAMPNDQMAAANAYAQPTQPIYPNQQPIGYGQPTGYYPPGRLI